MSAQAHDIEYNAPKSVTTISANARVDYILRFSKHAVLVFGPCEGSLLLCQQKEPQSTAGKNGHMLVAASHWHITVMAQNIPVNCADRIFDMMLSLHSLVAVATTHCWWVMFVLFVDLTVAVC